MNEALTNQSTKTGSTTSAGLRFRVIVMLGVLTLLAIGPLVVYPVVLMKMMCFGIFALSFNLLIGYGGLLSFGHAAFFGLGSYVCAGLATAAGMGPGMSVLCGVLAASAIGALFGWIAIRRDGIYFAMITLALAQMVYFLSVQNPQLTGGENGIQAVPRGKLFGLVDLSDDRTLYVAVSVVFVVAVLFVMRVIDSPFGRVCAAIRDNEARAISLGYEVKRYKVLLFTLSAGLAGLAGSAKALVFQLATLTDVHWSTSGEVILMTLLGGMGTVLGPLIGAAVVVSLQNFLSGLGEWVTVIQGVIFATCVMSFRSGIVGAIQSWFGKRHKGASEIQ